MAAVCTHCASHAEHPVWACLISDRRWFQGDAAVDTSEFARATHWDADAQPLLRLASYNREKRVQVGPKSSRSAAPFHTLLLLVGGFARDASAQLFVRLMASTSRKFVHRVARGTALARVWHLLDATQPTPLRIASSHPEQAREVCARADPARLEASVQQLMRAAQHALL